MPLLVARAITKDGDGGEPQRGEDDGMAPLEEHLTALYLDAPPIGVTLIIAAACTGVAGFAERHPQLFRDKTARIIHLGGALLEAGRVTVGSKPWHLFDPAEETINFPSVTTNIRQAARAIVAEFHAI